MTLNKIIGYILLVVGLTIIAGTLYQSYNIFTAKASAPLIFKTPLSAQQDIGFANQDAQSQINSAVKKQINQILPADSITKTLNLLSWSIFAGILVLGGGAISGIGVKLIK
jgi:hypothetical protein